ncbi:MAG: metal-dependent hydrolase [Natronomonas sp.]
MLFLTHLAVAVLLGRVSRLSTMWLVAGAALPDIIDKPLGAFGVFELYHSIGHSVFFLLFLVPIAWYTRDRMALVVGWGSHLFFDAVHVVINGRPGHTLAFLWPLAESADPLAIPPGAFFWYYLGTPSFYLEIVLWVTLGAIVIAQRPSDRSPP